MKAFHAYDIRGIYNKDFTADDAYKVGFFLPKLLKCDKVLVGRDVRLSSDEIFEALAQGITDGGADVYNAGITTTPMVYYITAKHDFRASVMITASHNAKEYNGMKISRENALPVGYDTGLSDIEQMMKNETIIPANEKGIIKDYEVRDEYIAFLSQYVPELSNFNIAIDCSNGMAGLLIKSLLGDHPYYIYDQPDGTFPNHDPNPLKPENLKDLKQIVEEKKCDIGVIFDGDADRVMFTDENGEFISPDLMIAILGHYFFEQKGQRGKVLQDIRTSKAVQEYLSKYNSEVHTWRVGRAFAAHKLREINGVFGGELAGHYYFRDFYYSDSGLLACLILLGLFKKFKDNGKTVSEVIERVKKYDNSGEINFRIENKQGAMEAVKANFEKNTDLTAFLDFDGYRLEFNDWWFNIRPSNTEPYLRLIVEAKSKSLLDEKVDQIKQIINQFD